MVPVSLVIPTLGKNNINTTLKCIVRSIEISPEIILVIGVKSSLILDSNYHGMVKVIRSDKDGQVYQRALGFRVAKHKYVIQLDDDVSFSETLIINTIRNLIKIGLGNVIGITFKNVNENVINENSVIKLKLKSLYHKYLCGLKEDEPALAMLSSTTAAMYKTIKDNDHDLYRADWLAGGFVASHKEDLILSDFYPYKGKAYCEDIFHSHYRSVKNTKHWIYLREKATTPLYDDLNFNLKDFVKEFKIRRDLSVILQCPQYKFFIFMGSSLLIRATKYLIKKYFQ